VRDSLPSPQPLPRPTNPLPSPLPPAPPCSRRKGDPKAIPWSHVTPLRCAADAFFHQDVRPGDVLCWPTSMGWMMGPWLVYAALLNSATVAIFQGSPLGRPFGAFVQRARVAVLGLVPSIVKVGRRGGCGHVLRSLHGLREVQRVAGYAPGRRRGEHSAGMSLACSPQGWRASGCMRGLDWSCIRCFRWGSAR
jgi:hypothetical protein